MVKKSFEAWKKAVDAEILRRTGMTSDDLEDYSYRDCYDNGVSPKNAAAGAIRRSKDN